ncbi:hypothetical protein B0F90DRAFT_1918517 [Multifurca ochricompacta]|uniref:Uncharacterized protein n=1 Tax=Multifurca ochricompacta TaxID=376703 RepID=A0AAD4M1A8_9AGAM|nr:hypothetical protein B0F90DRAFT_1918517 [Multifurca ochricompacta]
MPTEVQLWLALTLFGVVKSRYTIPKQSRNVQCLALKHPWAKELWQDGIAWTSEGCLRDHGRGADFFRSTDKSRRLRPRRRSPPQSVALEEEEDKTHDGVVVPYHYTPSYIYFLRITMPSNDKSCNSQKQHQQPRVPYQQSQSHSHTQSTGLYGEQLWDAMNRSVGSQNPKAIDPRLVQQVVGSIPGVAQVSATGNQRQQIAQGSGGQYKQLTATRSSQTTQRSDSAVNNQTGQTPNAGLQSQPQYKFRPPIIAGGSQGQMSNPPSQLSQFSGGSPSQYGSGAKQTSVFRTDPFQTPYSGSEKPHRGLGKPSKRPS